MVTLEGAGLQVLYPGRPAPGAGPDFRDAVMITPGGELVRGDVEVHVRQGDWRGHGHHLDPRYSGVVLHLFLRGESGRGTAGNGAQEVRLDAVPHAALRPPPAASPRDIPVAAAPLQELLELPRRRLEQALDEAGDRRFLRKASAMLVLMRNGDSREALFSALMEALGYSRNRVPMLRLARELPLGALRSLIGDGANPLSLEALLLGAAGLLPHQRGLLQLTPEGAEHTAELSDIWRSSGLSPAATPGDWDRAGIRPHNRPERRLAGAAVILARYWRDGLENGLRRACENSRPAGILRALQAESHGFWASHLDFHRPSTGAPSLVGAGRAGEMVVNALLPFFYAKAHLTGDADLRSSSLQLYSGAPPCPDNEVTREMKALMAASKGGCPVVNSARRQQGLIQVYRVLQGRAAPAVARRP